MLNIGSKYNPKASKGGFIHPKMLKNDSVYHPKASKEVVHHKMLKIGIKYNLKASKVVLFIMRCLILVANTIRRLQKCFRSSENA